MLSASQGTAAPGGCTSGGYRAGDTIADRYVLERPLREGGMGVVWVARSKALDVQVALKLLPEVLTNPESIERMSREARAAARLGHPAIVRVIDFGVTETAQAFIAMELLAGEELYCLLQRHTKLPPSQAVGLLLPVIDGLAAAHRAGIVHRDIKPENIFIARDEFHRIQPKLVDFGIAKLEGDRARRLTQSGALLGTPQYLSPEQAVGHEDIDARTDVWSIGVVLYELLTGTPPFTGKTAYGLIRSIVEDEPRPLMDAGVGDEELWRVVRRCLCKEPEDRWQSIWVVGRELALWLVQHGVDSDAAARSLRDVWLAHPTDDFVPSGERSPKSERPGAETLVPESAPSTRPSAGGYALPVAGSPGERGPAPTRPKRADARVRRVLVSGLITWMAIAIASWIALHSKAAGLDGFPAEHAAPTLEPPRAPPPVTPPASTAERAVTTTSPTSSASSAASTAAAAPTARRKSGRHSSSPSTTRSSIDPEFGF